MRRLLIPAIQRLTAAVLGIVFIAVLLEVVLQAIGLFARPAGHGGAPSPSTIPIVCFGDSMTAAQYPPKLQQMLDDTYGRGRFLVIDKGKQVTGSAYILSILRETLDQHKPGFIVVMTGFNDFFLPARMRYDTAGVFGGLKVFRLYFFLRRELSCARLVRAAHGIGRDGTRVVLPPMDPQFEGLLARGERCWSEGRRDDSEPIFLLAKSLCPADRRAYWFLYSIYSSRNRDPDISLLMKEMSRHCPGQAIIMQADILRRRGQIRQAAETLEEGLRSFPGNEEFIIVLLSLYRAEGRQDKIRELLFANQRYIGARAVYCLENRQKNEANRLFEELEAGPWAPATRENLAAIYRETRKRNIQMVCMQYPMRSVLPLKKDLSDCRDIIYIDNEDLFKNEVERSGFDMVFVDQFAGDHGHCTAQGNEMIARNIVATLRDKFDAAAR